MKEKLGDRPNSVISHLTSSVLQELIDTLSSQEKSIFPLEGSSVTKVASYVYHLPGGIDEHILQQVILYEGKTRIHITPALLQAIISLNPELADIKCEGKTDLLLGGVASRINPDDIKYFIEVLNGKGRNENDKNAMAKKALQHYITKQVIAHNLDRLAERATQEYPGLDTVNDEHLKSIQKYSMDLLAVKRASSGNRQNRIKELQEKPVLAFKLLKQIWQYKNNTRFGCVISPVTFFKYFGLNKDG